MPNNAHDAVLGDFGSIDMMATQCCSNNILYYICGDCLTFHSTAVLCRLCASTIVSNALHVHATRIGPSKEAGVLQRFTRRIPYIAILVSRRGLVTLHSTLYSTSRGVVRFAWRHQHAVHC